MRDRDEERLSSEEAFFPEPANTYTYTALAGRHSAAHRLNNRRVFGWGAPALRAAGAGGEDGATRAESVAEAEAVRSVYCVVEMDRPGIKHWEQNAETSKVFLMQFPLGGP